MVILILIAFILACFSIDAIVKYSRRRRLQVASKPEVTVKIFNEASVNIPMGVFFDRSHTWAFMEKNGQVKIGIDDFLLHITGPLQKVKMKSPGEKIQKGDPIMTIVKNGKQLIVNSPISGVVKSNNFRLADNGKLISESPFNEGWVYMVEPANWARETQFMFIAEKYREWLKNEFSRLKDFFAMAALPNNVGNLQLAYQDGGELVDHVLSECTPEVWEEFQMKFINTSK